MPPSHVGATSARGVRPGWNEKKKHKKRPETQGSPEYGLTLGYIRRRYRGLMLALPREAGEERSLFSR